MATAIPKSGADAAPWSPYVVEAIDFPTRRARAVLAPRDLPGEEAVAALALPPARGVVLLNGGTSGLVPELAEPLRRMLAEGLARVAIEERLTVITGATDAGIFALCGGQLGENATAPLIGVAPDGLVTWPGREPLAGREAGAEELVPLEPHHSHFLLVAGEAWGDETEAMLTLATALRGTDRSVAVIAGGGEGTRTEALGHIRQGREVIALSGSGRFADQLADAVEGRGSDDQATAEIAASGLVTVLAVSSPPAALAGEIRARLRRGARMTTAIDRAARRLRERLGVVRILKRLAMLRDLPLLHWRPREAYPLVRPELREGATPLAEEFKALDQVLVPVFNELDQKALRGQNYFRLGHLMLIIGGALATSLGALQTALGAGELWVAIAGAVVSGVSSGVVFYMRGRDLQREYFASRLKAELLRSEYFVFLGRVDPYTAKDLGERVRTLRRRVAEVESGELAS